jgi:hypothetical protein
VQDDEKISGFLPFAQKWQIWIQNFVQNGEIVNSLRSGLETDPEREDKRNATPLGVTFLCRLCSVHPHW